MWKGMAIVSVIRVVNCAGIVALEATRPPMWTSQRRLRLEDSVINLILLVVALVLFVLAAISVPVPRINLVATGLAFWVLANLLSGLKI